ncbi:hypothetical protein ACMG4J_05040 [Rossellomorea marisflavi]|uniref:hypothetical protein n=1 Tax=Rossellomorea marisflavi TaxID=189381 RepID=UPI0039BEF1A0
MNKGKLVMGWCCFAFSVILFLFQGLYLILRLRWGVEYADDRLFYLLTTFIVVFATVALLLLMDLKRNGKAFLLGIATIFILLQGVLLFRHMKDVREFVSHSPDWKTYLVLKQDRLTGKTVYYRPFYGPFVQGKETLPFSMKGDAKIKWIQDDIVAATYHSEDGSIHQFIGTYGDRGQGSSYTNVALSFPGTWKEGDLTLTSTTDGLILQRDHEVERYTWENIVQFGTLAVVLTENDEAQWTIALGEDFISHENDPDPPAGSIYLYEATDENNEPVPLTLSSP